jgi:hypothetical protein
MYLAIQSLLLLKLAPLFVFSAVHTANFDHLTKALKQIVKNLYLSIVSRSTSYGSSLIVLLACVFKFYHVYLDGQCEQSGNIACILNRLNFELEIFWSSY